MMGMVHMYGLDYLMVEIDNAGIEVSEGFARSAEDNR